MTTTVKDKILRSDMALYDGLTTTRTRKDSTGGTIIGLKVGTEVDVLQVYGGGTSYTKSTIQKATNAIGTASVTLLFQPGTWVIEDDITIASNFVCRVPAGCIFSPNSGKTLTFSGPVIHDAQTWTGGSGTVTENGTRYFTGLIDLTGAVLQGGSPLVFEGATANAFETTLIITDPTADRTITLPDASGTMVTTEANNTFTGSNTFNGVVNYAATSGTDTYTATPSPAFTSYTIGAHYFISFGNANATTTPTLNLNSLGAKTIVKNGAGALLAGDIPASHKAVLMYDGTNMVLLNPKQQSESYIYIRDEKANNTDGGTFTAGAWQTRVLNTEVNDAGGYASLSANQITLAAGTYRFAARAPGYQVGRHKIRLANVTDSIFYYGTNKSASSTSGTTTTSNVAGRFTIAASKVFEVQHYCDTTTATTGFGIASVFGVIEVYAEAEFWKEI